MPPRLSVVVPCHNRAKYLDVHLRSLTWSALSASEFEVVVVDDGSEDGVGDVVAAWRRQGLDVRLIRVDRPSGVRNNAAARNAGLAGARFPVIVQTDPDIVFVSDVLREAQQTIVRRVFLSCCGYYPLTRESTETVAFGVHATVPERAAFLEHAGGRPNQALSPDGVGGLHGAFVVWREDLEAAGGYDESFRHWGWEDRELIVTLEHRGLVRRVMRSARVVHLWHPIARGDLGRESLARQGCVSQAAWDVQMQRAAAEYPRPLRPSSVAGPRTPGQRFHHAAFAEWEAGADADRSSVHVPLAHQLFFDAHRLEAAALYAIGAVALARELLLDALQRPWELPCQSDALRTTPPGAMVELHPSLRRYQRVCLVVEALAVCESDLGHSHQYEIAVRLLDACEGGRPLAAAMRARNALRNRDLPAAHAVASGLMEESWTPSTAALAVEIALLDDRPGDAWRLLDGALDRLEHGDFFEQIRLAEYLRLLGRLDETRIWHPVFSRLDRSEWGRDATEFVFSAAVRSCRAGLDVAAVLLFSRFLAAPGRSEARLIDEATAHRAAALARVERVGGRGMRQGMRVPPAIAHDRYGTDVKPYSRSNDAIVCCQS